MAVPANIVFGDGVFSLNGTAVALTRGGGTFSIEREYKQIEADGDYGPVKGRIRKTKSVAKIKFNALELLPANLTEFYPGMGITSIAAKDTLAASAGIVDTDYNTVSWTGYTQAGKQVYIELANAINLENIEWALVDKEEIVPELTYTSTYLESARTTEPWKIDFATAAPGDLVTPTMIVSAPVAGATTQIVLEFSEKLSSVTYAITDIANLLASATNDGVAIAVTTVASSVTWADTATSNPKAIIKIPSTTFVAGKSLRVFSKTSAIKDVALNEMPVGSHCEAVVTA